MTLNGVIALILRYFIALEVDYMTVVEARSIISAEYRLPLLAKTDPPCSAVSLLFYVFQPAICHAIRMLL